MATMTKNTSSNSTMTPDRKLAQTTILLLSLSGALLMIPNGNAGDLEIPYHTKRTVKFDIRGYQGYSTGQLLYRTYVDIFRLPGEITIGEGGVKATLHYDQMEWTNLGGCANNRPGGIADCINGLTSNAWECSSWLGDHLVNSCRGCDGPGVTGQEKDGGRTAARNAIREKGDLVFAVGGKEGEPMPPGDYTINGNSWFKNRTSPIFEGYVGDDRGAYSAACLYDVVNIR